MFIAAVIIVGIVAAAMVTVITAAIAVMTVTSVVVAVVFGASVKMGSGDLIVGGGTWTQTNVSACVSVIVCGEINLVVGEVNKTCVVVSEELFVGFRGVAYGGRTLVVVVRVVGGGGGQGEAKVYVVHAKRPLSTCFVVKGDKWCSWVGSNW